MKYMGSKNRIAKHILPIMLDAAQKRGITTWVEHFVGGGNMIDKVPIHFKRIGIDANPHTIAALIGIRDFLDDLPSDVSEEYYKSIKKTGSNPITSWIRFECSFGAKFENGFARNAKKSNYAWMGLNLAKKQSPKLQGVELICGNYLDYSEFENCSIYADPPYFGTTSYKTDKFDHKVFWQWCRKMSEKNVVFISEYQAPDDFACIWEGQVKTNFASQRSGATHNATEKLFIHHK